MLSEATAKAQVRYGDLRPVNPPPTSLVDLADIKTFFGIQDSSLDSQLTMASAMVTSVIRNHTGRYLTKGTYVETFTDVMDQKPERYLIETPVELVVPPTNGDVVTLLQQTTGRVLLMAGPAVEVTYEGGYDPMPADLLGVFFELIRQQMGAWGFDTLGTSKPSAAPMERSVTIGSLRVEYAVSAASMAAKASSGSPLSSEALTPFAMILDHYLSYRRLVAT